VTYYLNTYFFNDGTTGTHGAQYGPFSIGTATKLLSVDVTMVFIAGPNAEVLATPIIDPWVFGVQYVPHGSSPIDPYSVPSDPAWLCWQTAAPSANVRAWSPSTADFGVVLEQGVTLRWRGQRPVAEAIDFYVSTAQYYDAGDVTSTVNGAVRIVHTF
jgi:hypothetical protein